MPLHVRPVPAMGTWDESTELSRNILPNLTKLLIFPSIFPNVTVIPGIESGGFTEDFTV
jgi:hypothetical protein